MAMKQARAIRTGGPGSLIRSDPGVSRRKYLLVFREAARTGRRRFDLPGWAVMEMLHATACCTLIRITIHGTVCAFRRSGEDEDVGMIVGHQLTRYIRLIEGRWPGIR